MNDVLIIDVRPDIAEKLRFEGVGKPLGLATVIVSAYSHYRVLRSQIDQFIPTRPL